MFRTLDKKSNHRVLGLSRPWNRLFKRLQNKGSRQLAKRHIEETIKNGDT